MTNGRSSGRPPDVVTPPPPVGHERLHRPSGARCRMLGGWLDDLADAMGELDTGTHDRLSLRQFDAAARRGCRRLQGPGGLNAPVDGQRKCRRCDAPLSRYNSDALCAGCAKESPGNTIAPSWWLDSEELRRALSSLDLGAALRIMRLASGLSQLEFAAILGWDQAEVSRAERGQRPTLYDIRRLFEVADAIDMPLAALIPVITGGDHDSPSRQQEEVPGMSMNRRELGGTLLGLAAAVGLSPVQIPAKVDPAHVRYFSAAVDQLYAQDQSIGGGALVRDGLRLYDRARRMLDESDYSEETARQLMVVAASLPHVLAGCTMTPGIIGRDGRCIPMHICSPVRQATIG
jgi:transcriptional regulator with XRE-family HTH domain